MKHLMYFELLVRIYLPLILNIVILFNQLFVFKFLAFFIIVGNIFMMEEPSKTSFFLRGVTLQRILK